MIPGSSKKLVLSRARSLSSRCSPLNELVFKMLTPQRIIQLTLKELIAKNPKFINPRYPLLIADPIRGALKLGYNSHIPNL